MFKKIMEFFARIEQDRRARDLADAVRGARNTADIERMMREYEREGFKRYGF